MELTKKDNQMAKGIAIIAMVMLHLFCKKVDLPYTPLLWIGDTPLVYYLGLLGEICVPIYLFCSGYAQALLRYSDGAAYVKKSWIRILNFLLNYWIVLILAVILGAFFDSEKRIPGSILSFLENFFLYRFSYNGIWWFVSTYIQLVALSPLILKLIRRCPPVLTVLVSGALYLASILYIRLFDGHIENEILAWIGKQVSLLVKSQFSFVIGCLCYEYKVMTKLRSLKHINLIALLLSPVLIILMCILENAVFAPIFGLSLILLFQSVKKPKFLCAVLCFFGAASTNIWLTHTFFFARIFPNLVYRAKYPLIIALAMFALCFLASIVVNCLYRPLSKLLLDRLSKKSDSH